MKVYLESCGRHSAKGVSHLEQILIDMLGLMLRVGNPKISLSDHSVTLDTRVKRNMIEGSRSEVLLGTDPRHM